VADRKNLFCVKQFKPAIALIVLLAVGIIGWTMYRDIGNQGAVQNWTRNGALMPVATAPPIRAGVPATHPEWGPCTNCHDVIGAGTARPAASLMRVATAPPIRAGVPATHPDWGPCANCHDIVGAAPARQAAATITAATVAPLIGAWLRPITPAAADKLGLDNPHGALVTGVHQPSPAARAGLEIGDVIRRVDNKQVETVNETLALIENAKPGSTIKLLVRRSGRERKIYVDLSAPARTSPQMAQAGAGATGATI
jgi:membrane-associated protease RseP (regulator of RpoE activity)